MFDPFPKSWKKVIHPQRNKVIVENFVSRLHSHIIVSLLMVAIGLVCSIKYFGGTITCSTLKSTSNIPEGALNAYCYIGNTYTVIPRDPNQHANFIETGVGYVSDGDTYIKQTYYQWVPFVLTLQAIFFYLPHFLRKMIDDGYVNKMVAELKGIVMISHDEKDYVIGEKKKEKEKKEKDEKNEEKEKDDRIRIYSQKTLDGKLTQLSNHYKTMLKFEIHRSWACAIIACEIANLVIVLGQVCYINKFLYGHFLSLGWNMLFPDNFTMTTGITALDTIFPKLTKCDFKTYGSSGSLQNYDVACVMPLNQVNEKIFLCLWYCLLVLFVLNIVNLVIRFTQFLLHKEPVFSNLWLNKTSASYLRSRQLNALLSQHSTFFDWMLLRCVGDNMDPNLFGQLLVKLNEGDARTADEDNCGGVLIEELKPLNEYTTVNVNTTFGFI